MGCPTYLSILESPLHIIRGLLYHTALFLSFIHPLFHIFTFIDCVSNFGGTVYWGWGEATKFIALIGIIWPVQFSHSVMSNSFWPHGLQACRLLYLSPNPRAYSNSCPSSQWCHPTISSSVLPFSSCLQSFPASESFPISQFFVSDGQSIGVSASASVLHWIFRTDFI